MQSGRFPDDRDWHRTTFSARQLGFARAYIEGLLAEENDAGELVPPRHALVERLVFELEQWVASGSSTMSSGFGALLYVLEGLPVVVMKRPTTMTRLSLHDRIEFFERLENSPVGLLATAFIGMKLPVSILAFEVGQELQETGFDRPNLATPGPFRKLNVIQPNEGSE